MHLATPIATTLCANPVPQRLLQACPWLHITTEIGLGALFSQDLLTFSESQNMVYYSTEPMRGPTTILHTTTHSTLVPE